MTDSLHNSEAAATHNIAKLPNQLRYAEWSDLVRWGILRCGAQNKYFCEVALPSGWSVRPGEAADWQELVDDKGRVRADIYSCHNFASTRAFMALRRRITTAYEFSQDGSSLRVVVMDGNERMHSTSWMACDANSIDKTSADRLSMSDFLAIDADSFRSEAPLHNGDALKNIHDWHNHRALEEQAKAWLRTNFPAWQNPLSYWDFEC